MRGKRNPDLHIVNESDPVEEAINEIMEEIREENDLLDELEEKIRQSKIRFMRRIMLGVLAVALMLAGAYVFVTTRTYDEVHILETYKNKADEGEQYVRFADGILKYGRDGASFVDKKGKGVWNAAYQFKNPIVSVRGNTAAIADKSGNDISVFQKKGLKGEIHTNLPIEKIVVSNQGIVGTVLKDETASMIVCYDAAGNILVEHKTSAATTGYPLDLDISEDGCMLLVSYLLVEEGTLTSKVTYYDFREDGQNKENYLAAEDTYKNELIPSVFFMDNNTSAVVADDALIIYKGKKTPAKISKIGMKNEIKSVFHNEKYIGIVSQSGEKNLLSLYDGNGEEVLSEKFDGDYKNIRITGNQIVMFDGKRCNIFTKSGVHKFDGEFETDIIDVFPIFGINKYLVINANGLEEIRFAK